MFDERSPKWIEYYKNGTIVMFWLYLLTGVVLCIVGWCDGIWITDSPFLDGLILLAAGCFVAFAQLVCNMLIIQLLNNVQIIRETIEDANIPQSDSYEDKPVAKQKVEALVYDLHNELQVQPTEHIHTSDIENSNNDNQPVSAMIKNDEKVCPKCGRSQKVDRKVCWSCGQRFDN